MVKKIIFILVILGIDFCQCQSINRDTIFKEDELIFYTSSPPMPVDLGKFIKETLKYPESAKKDSIEGIVYTSFWIDTLGYTSEHTIIKGVREDLDNEALRIVKLIKFDKPAMQGEKPIRIKFRLPVRFFLSEKETPVHRRL